MGWSFFTDKSWDKPRLVEYLMSERRLGAGQRVLRHALVGNHLWTVIEQDRDGDEPRRFIGLDLLASGGRTEGWGYKDLCESMGPCEVDCPLSFLDMVPMPDNEYAAPWRDEVRAHHRIKAQLKGAKSTLAPGQTLTWGGQTFTLVRPHARNGRAAGWVVDAASGDRYRLTAKMVNEAVADKLRSAEAEVSPDTAAETLAPPGETAADLFDQAA